MKEKENTLRVTCNFTVELIERVEEYAKRMNVNRTAAMSVLLSTALDNYQMMNNLEYLTKSLKENNEK